MNFNAKTNEKMLAVIGLLIVALFWGFGYPGLKFCENIPTFFTMTSRFLLAVILLSVIFHKKLKLINKDLLKAGIIIGVLMFACYAFATIGIKYTTASRTAFFTGLGAICAPILNYLLYRIKLTKKAFLCVVICAIGVYCISMGGTGGLGLSTGDLICFGSSIFAAGQIIAVERKSANFDIYALSIVELFTITVLSAMGMLVCGESIPTSFTGTEIGALLFIGIFCSAVAFVLQLGSLKHITSNRACLILTLEPVLGAVASMVIFGDRLGISGYIGGVLVVGSIIISEYTASEKEKEAILESD